MKIVKPVAVAALICAAGVSLAARAQQSEREGFWTTPVIQGYGRIHFLPNAGFRPQADHTYQIVFALTKGGMKPAEVNPALDRVARTVNLYVAAGVPLSRLKFVAIVYGPATPLALDDAHYRTAYGVPNPNLPLIAELKKAGVTVAVCAQAVAEQHFGYDAITPDVTLALSGLTTVTTLESQGYVLMPL
ncbi:MULTISPECIES: DsrE family protein [unclassified Paraburkholderia]|uniref:DsrE family protein n=1 Tax=unclassified Paraburkholderia TaxID=2615204 RepID=UPI002AB65068|nr:MULTISPECIES: DsrE family protein [unclassified Paraburkholderia]